MRLLVMLILLMLVRIANAQELDVSNGRDLYAFFCAECHGKDAASTGPMAEMLAIDPPALSRLSLGNDGVFPLAEVAIQIDGRMPSITHSFMPVFGPSLDSNKMVAITLQSGQPMLLSRQLADLIAYLQTIQEVGK